MADFDRTTGILHDVLLTALDRIKATTRDPEVLGIIADAEAEHDAIEGREIYARSLMPAHDNPELERAAA